jgi:hypothetical protein
VPQGGYLGFNQTNEEMIRFNKKDFLDFLKTRLRGVTIGIYWFEKPTRPEVYEGGGGALSRKMFLIFEINAQHGYPKIPILVKD